VVRWPERDHVAIYLEQNRANRKDIWGGKSRFLGFKAQPSAVGNRLLMFGTLFFATDSRPGVVGGPGG
jgi:hypothetical protein